jgi:hypothetical protein
MKTRVQVLAVETKEFLRKSGGKGSFQVCKCVVHLPDGRLDVGELTVFEDLKCEVQPGEYVIEYGASVRDGKVGASLKSIVPAADAMRKEVKAA